MIKGFKCIQFSNLHMYFHVENMNIVYINTYRADIK